MPIPRTYRAEAIVLKGMDLGEADRIVTLYTRYFGKLRAIAKGARRPTSRLAGHVEPLAHATFHLLATALRHLDRGEPSGLVCRWFDLHLLDRAGFRPELFRCVRCTLPLDERDHLFSPGAGGVLCARCRAEAEGTVHVITVRAVKSLRYLLRSEFAEAARLRLDAALSLELERHLRSFLQVVLDRDVKEQRLLDDVRGLQSARA